MRREFSYTKNDQTLSGVLVGIDCLVGPLSVSLHEGEECYTYLAGYSQAGCDALFVKQEIDGLVAYHHEQGEGAESLLARFLNWIPSEGSDLVAVLHRLLAEYLFDAKIDLPR
jgi:hypothetical protein